MGHQVMVEFVINKQVGLGDSLMVVGNIASLGSWVPSSGLPMHLDLTSSWSASVSLPAGLTFEYKIVHFSTESKGVSWMLGSNRTLVVPPCAAMVSIISMWDFVAGSTPVTITFGTIKQVNPGQHLILSGDSVQLGQWNLYKGHTMVWHVGDRWKVDVNLAAGSTINYKYVVASDQVKEVNWMPGSNRVLHVPKGSIAIAIFNNWATNSAPITPCPPPLRVQLVAVYFVLEHPCAFGHLFKLVGNIAKLGKWDTLRAHKMVWHFDDIWIAAIIRPDYTMSLRSWSLFGTIKNLPAGTFIEYKIVLVQETDDAIIQWQMGVNRKLVIPDAEFELVVRETWQNC